MSFDDTKVSEYNKMNIPGRSSALTGCTVLMVAAGFDRVLMLRKIELAEQAHSLFETFSRTFRDHDQVIDPLALRGACVLSM